MGKHIDMLNKVFERLQDPASKTHFLEAMDTHLDKLAAKSPDLYAHAMQKLEEISCAIEPEQAKAIVAKMYPRGQKWTLEEVKRILLDKNIQGKDVKYYLAINMAYNDYYDTASAFGLQRDPEFFFMLAKDFVEDPDAKPMKIEKYFKE